MLPASGDVHPVSPPPVTERRPFRDNPRLVLLGIALLIAALVAMVTLADRSTELNPDFLSEVVLYAVSAAPRETPFGSSGALTVAIGRSV